MDKVEITIDSLALLLSFKAEREGSMPLADSLAFLREYDDSPLKRDMALKAAKQLGVDLG